jgi:hypothetical protein
MAIKKESLKAILVKLKVGTDAEIDALINDQEEKEVAIDAVKVFTSEEYTQLETNLKEQGKGAYTKAGKEIAIKELKEKTGLDFDGKDPEVFLEKYKEHVIADANVKPNEAKVQWEKDKAQLQGQISEWKGKYEAVEVEKKTVARDAYLLKKFPAERDKALSDEDRLLLIKSKTEIKDEDGKEVVYYKGQKLADNLTNPLDMDKAISHIFKEENWIGDGAVKLPGGRGDGDKHRKPNTFASLKEFNAHLETSGIHPGSEQARNLLQDAMKTNPDINMAEII